ncbi:MAG: hypothetical protein V7607_2607 [Solirubrobacteraceae bacterium]
MTFCARSRPGRTRTTLLNIVVVAATMAFVMGLASGATAFAQPSAPLTTFTAWATSADFQSGQFDHTRPTVVAGRPAVVLSAGAQAGTWTSPVHDQPVPIGDLVSSWQASTPVGTRIEMRLSIKVANHWSQWYIMGKWAFEDTPPAQRTSVNGQSDADGTIYTDTYVSGSNGKPSAYRLRISLLGTPSRSPQVYQVAATTSNVTSAPATSSPTLGHAVDLPLPQYSQEIHAGEYPAYGGGGEVWCSPTSTAMVLAYWHRGPTAADLASLPPDPVFDAHGRVDAQVDWAAIHTWDVAYEGTGNWPFNTAYASAYGLDGSVRQYASLPDVERWVQRLVPVVIATAWDNTDTSPDNDLTGAPIPKSAGHLMVVRGFTASGDVIVNDPAAPTNSQVRRVYRRAQFERNWLNFGSGTTYIIKP